MKKMRARKGCSEPQKKRGQVIIPLLQPNCVSGPERYRSMIAVTLIALRLIQSAISESSVQYWCRR